MITSQLAPVPDSRCAQTAEEISKQSAVIFRDLTLGYGGHPAVHHPVGVSGSDWFHGERKYS